MHLGSIHFFAVHKLKVYFRETGRKGENLREDRFSGDCSLPLPFLEFSCFLNFRSEIGIELDMMFAIWHTVETTSFATPTLDSPPIISMYYLPYKNEEVKKFVLY